MAHRSESDDDRGVGRHAAGARIISSTNDRIDQLYGLTQGEFAAARNTLAKELRSEGHRDEAAQVAKLRRPTIAVWAINRAVRGHRDRFAAFLDAGQQVRRAQRRALSGVRDSGLREATRSRRQLIDELTGLAAQSSPSRDPAPRATGATSRRPSTRHPPTTPLPTSRSW